MINSCFNIDNNGDDDQIQYNIIALGNSGVGKTCIFNRLSKDIFSENNVTTIGYDSFIYYIKYKEKKYKLTLNDPSGQEQFKSITKNFLRNTDGVLFIYDISSQDLFYGLESWYELYKNENKEVIGLLIGSKSDLERKVNIEEAKKFAEEMD